MVFDESFGPALVNLMTRAYDGAYGDLRAAKGDFELTEAASRMMALRIIIAVSTGEQDVDTLKAIAFNSVAPNDHDHSS